MNRGRGPSCTHLGPTRLLLPLIPAGAWREGATGGELSIHRHGEIRDRTGEGQHYRIAGMNLLAAGTIYGEHTEAGRSRDRPIRHRKPDCPQPAFICVAAWLGTINLTGEYG